MLGSGIHAVQLILLLLLLFVVVFSTLARRLKTPYPIVLVVAGLLLGFVPGIPKITLDPDVIFFVVLPPLLYSAAWNTSWRDFRHNFVSIASLAIGLVAFTVFGVAAAASWLIVGFDWRVGFVLGAVVATTDSIAATSIAKRIGLPKRIVDVLEGESLVNDATGLLALEFATAMVVYGQTPTISYAIARLAYLIASGIAVGLILGRIVEWFEHRIDDGPIEIALSLFVPYAAYLAGEAVHGSGVLAVVAGGLYLSRRSSRFFSPSVRLQAGAVWNSLDLHTEWTGICPNRTAASLCTSGNQGVGLEQAPSLRRSLQRILNSPPAAVEFSQRIRRLSLPKVSSQSKRYAARRSSSVCDRLDRDARRHCACGCDFIAAEPRGWHPISSSQSNRVSNFQCHSRDACSARAYACASHSRAGSRDHIGTGLRRARSTPNDA